MKKKTLTTFTHKAFCTARRTHELTRSGVLELELRWEQDAGCFALRSSCDTVFLITRTSLFDLSSIQRAVAVSATLTEAGCTTKTGDINICTQNWKRNKRLTLGIPFLWIFYFNLFNHESMWHIPLSLRHTNPMEPLHLPVCIRVFLLACCDSQAVLN